ncbi:hypothetical protein J8J27_32155, partial [Mycobacterium tuberculosis]|nr:hypothetical protein [Mycobacterium tuberculosis]
MFGGAVTGATVDLGDDNDSLTFAAGGATVTVTNVETVTGSTSDDTVTVASYTTGAAIDLGDGTDTVVF